MGAQVTDRGCCRLSPCLLRTVTSTSASGLMLAVLRLVAFSCSMAGCGPSVASGQGLPAPTEWIMQRYTEGIRRSKNSPLATKCQKTFTGIGGQQSWRKIEGQQFCFHMTSNMYLSDVCRDRCTIRVICARGGESGVRLQFFEGPDCVGKEGDSVEFMPHMTWPQVSAFVQGNCSWTPDGIYQTFSPSWRVGVDFPDCYGYDVSTRGAGIITADPKDSPMYLNFYSDPQCSKVYKYDSSASGNGSSTLQLGQQRWMAVLRTVAFDKRADNHKHCWKIQEGGPSTFVYSFKLKCDYLNDRRYGLWIHKYDNDECIGEEPKSKEVFFVSSNYGALSSGEANVLEVRKFFEGGCRKHSDGLWWKFDRPVHVEDWPNCYAEAVAEGYRMDRASMTSLNYKGDVGTVRKLPPFDQASHGSRAAFAPVAITWLAVALCFCTSCVL
eukprot:TRINITY_DN45836_c0_g1_i1.p1 TRINITY_DN45836_c0_g1~~TRINITY_DN45836_c0_g1_i1.p1  ORF type:complete len:439 (+),score=49.84 TRINITY_DN45836_c0_g1_i1:100-1416(+)